MFKGYNKFSQVFYLFYEQTGCIIMTEQHRVPGESITWAGIPKAIFLFLVMTFALMSFGPSASWAATEIIVDNDTPSSGFTRSSNWSTSAGTNPYDSSSLYATAANEWAKWTPTLPEDGTYDVYVWYTYYASGSNLRDREAPYTIVHKNGSSVVNVNQQQNASTWVLLGSYCFDTGTTGSVTVTRYNGGNHETSTNADAVKFVLKETSALNISDEPLDAQMLAAPPNIMFVLDDSGSMDWEYMTTESDGKFRIGSTSYEYVFSNPGDNVYSTSSSNGTILSGNNRRYYLSQTSGFNKMYYNPKVEYTPWPGMSNADPDNPRSHPGRTGNTFNMSNNYLTITNSNEVIVDNRDAGYSWTGNNFQRESSASNEWNNSSYYSRDTGDRATWSPNLAPGNYFVYAWWTRAGTRDSAAEYRINYDAGGSSTLLKIINQQNNYSQWRLLHPTDLFFDGSGNVTVTRSGNGTSTSADAVRFVPAAGGGNVDIINAHYYTWDDTDGDNEIDSGESVYLVNLDGAIEYYLIDNSDGDNRAEPGELTLVPAASVPNSVKKDWDGLDRVYAKERQNFANWYSYYRRRELTATAAVANVINSMQGVNIGIRSINGKIVQPAVPVKVGTEDRTTDLLNTLYAYNVTAQGTPLRTGLQKVGQYFHKDDNNSGGIGASPIAIASDGGECQQNFAIVMTDGYYNGSSPSTGNVDGDDGAPYADTYSSTLADVAMYYYENDLAGALDDLVPATLEDSAIHQHMVTFGISFGVFGTLNPDDYPAENDYKNGSGSYPNWPSPTSGNQQKIDDLWHASVNGHGTFISAADPQELVSSLLGVMQNIQARSGSAAAISVNGDELYESVGSDILLFQTSYNTDGWWGDLVAYGINYWTGEVITSPIRWSAADELENFLGVSGAGNRLVVTFDRITGSGIPFRYSSLNALQQTQLHINPTTADLILNYIRGEDANEMQYVGSGGFRNRTKKLGDFVNSSAVYNQGYLYVGNNDGMLHVIDSEYGTEVFSYVPSFAFDNLSELADPNYSHKYFVDQTPFVVRMDEDDSSSGTKTYLVGGLGKGGKGYFGIDVTSLTDGSFVHAETDVASMIKWEYPSIQVYNSTYSFVQGASGANDEIHDSSANFVNAGFINGSMITVSGSGGNDGTYEVLGVSAGVLQVANGSLTTEAAGSMITIVGDDPDMGYSFSKPLIVKTYATSINNGAETESHVVIFGNGYQSKNGNAVLYFVNPETGAVIKKIDTKVGPENGLSSTTPIDSDFDFRADYVYAGDLYGNMWKFDMTSSDPADWQVAYCDNADSVNHCSDAVPAAVPKPMFRAQTVTDACGNISFQPITAKPDIMLACDKKDGYMVIFGTGRYLDALDLLDDSKQTIYGIWDYGDDSDDSEYLGDFTPGSSPSLSNQPTEVQLLEQTQIFGGTNVVAEFSIIPDAPNSSDVDFNDASIGTITQWEWDFDGDGTVDSNFQNPTPFTYAEGNYTASLTVERATPLPFVSNTKEANVSVKQPWHAGIASELDGPVALEDNEVVANFTGSWTGDPANATVNFTDSSLSTAGFSAWYWDFGDGNFSSVQHPSHTYTVTGTYDVSLTVTHSDGTTQHTRTNTSYVTVSQQWEVDVEYIEGDVSTQWLRVISKNETEDWTVEDATAGEDPDPGTAGIGSDNFDNDRNGLVDDDDEDEDDNTIKFEAEAESNGITHAGWYFDLPDTRERVITDTIIRDGRAIVISFVPQASRCSTGGYSILHEFDACSGGRTDESIFDINFDNFVDDNDKIEVDESGTVNEVAPTGIRFDSRLQIPAILRFELPPPPTDPSDPDYCAVCDPNNPAYDPTHPDYDPRKDPNSGFPREPIEIKYLSRSDRNIDLQREKSEQRGKFYWREVTP